MALLGQGNFSIRKEVQGVKKIYTRSQLQPITPIGDNPIGWSAVSSTFDAPPNYGNLWSSSATIDPNGVVQGTWSSPTLEEPYTSNPLDRFPFTLGSGSQYPYTQYGGDNIREIGLNPFGVSDVIWRGKSLISTGFCGGIDTSSTYYYSLDNSKKYRVSFWFKRNTVSEGRFYFGLRGTTQSYATDWNDSSDFSLGLFQGGLGIVPDKWFLIVGYIYPSSQIEGVLDPTSGIYDQNNGNKCRDVLGICRQKEGVYKVGIRLAQHNCPTDFPEIRLWQPRIDLCDGREPSIEQLLKGSPKTPTVTISGETVFKFSSGQTVPENTAITLSAELTNGAASYQWQYFRISDSVWVNLSSGTSQTYSLPHNSSAFQSTSRIQIRCTTVVAGTTYTSNVMTITKVYDGIAGSNQAPLFLYQRSATSPAKPTNTAVWTFVTATYSTAPNNGWETAIPASNGTPCWVIQAVASGNGTTDTIAPTDWSDPRVLVQDGITSTLLDLTNETTVVSVDYNGNPIGSIETTQANVYEGNVLASGWTFTKVDSGCTSSIVGGLLTVSSMSADKATVTIKANKSGYANLTAVYSLTKLYPAKDGLPTPVYSLLPAHSSISKSKTGILTPSTTSCKVKLGVNGQTEIIGDDAKLDFFGRNMISEDMMFLWNTVNPTYPTIISKNADNSYTVKYSQLLGAYGVNDGAIFNLTFKENTQYVLAIDYAQTVANTSSGWYIIMCYTDGTYQYLMCLRDAVRRTQTLVSTKGKTVTKITTSSAFDGNMYVYNFKLEESSYFTGFTNAPEDYKITRNGSAYTSGASYTIGSTATEVVWSLVDPKGTTVDTERVPVVVDGSDGVNGNDGLNNTVVTLYKRSLVSSPEVPPAKPSTGTIVYNFSNLTVSGDLAGWSIEAPTFVAGTKLFKIVASVASYTTTTSIIPSAWVGPVKTEDTEAADLLRTDLNFQVERMDGLISDKVGSETFNALGTRVSAAESDISQTPTKISIAVSDIKTAGTNLVKNSRCNSIVGWDPLAQCVESVVSDSKYGNVVEIERISGTGNFQKTFSVDKAKLANTSVVYFVVAKRISASGEFYFGGLADTWNKLSSSTQNKIDHGDGWYLYWATFSSGATIGTGDFGISTITGKWRFYAVGATVGNKPPSTWTESDEDIRTDIEGCGINVTSKRILLNGNTEVVDSTGAVSKFSDGTFRSKRLITGGPGTDRIEIDGAVADPSISIIDSTDAVKVELSPKLIPTLTEIANAGGSSALTLHSAAIISLSLTSTGSLASDLGSVYNFGSLSFVMGKLGNIVTPAFSYSLIASRYTPDVDSYAKVSIDLQKYNGTSWIKYASVLNNMAIDSSKSTAPTQYILSNIPAGTYRFSMEITVKKGDESTVSAQVTTTLNAPYTLSYPIQKTIIGKDGTAMVWSTSQYARYGADGMEVRYGNYGLRVNNSGIQKTVNGGTWTNL